MNQEEAVRARQRLWNAVALLASPADTQKAWLKRVGTYPLADELVLEFDDCAVLTNQLVQSRALSEATASAIDGVAKAIDRLQSVETDWDAEALADSMEWSRVRRAAGFALVEIVGAQAV
ncbi:MAG: hypothetical protein AB7J35_06955 [Dehalococcoidia bacterium]